MKSALKRISCLGAALVYLACLLTGCGAQAKQEKVEYVIGVSQANMREPWRLVLNQELQDEAARYPNVRLVFTDATQDTEKQIKDIEKLQQYGADLLIVSPTDALALTNTISEVYRSIPVIVLDRGVEGYDYSLFIGPDNLLIGRQVGEDIVEMAGGKPTSVLEICGNPDSQASAERSEGYESIVQRRENITSRKMVVQNESRDSAEDLVYAMGKDLLDVDVIFAHNDYMALGACRALQRLGYGHIEIVGVDGFAGYYSGLQLVRSNQIDRTVTCPTGGKEAISYAMDILNHASGVPKQVILRSRSVTRLNVDEYEQSLQKEPKEIRNTVNIGYAQVGSESAWRLANAKSLKEAAKDFGFNLITRDADQSQQKQIEAVQEFIDMDVDVIVISPVVDSGWDEVLQRAKEKGIPVILSDRRITVSQDDLYMTFIGADFIEEGRRAMRWVAQNVPTQGRQVNILELQGTVGASPTLERKQGFELLLGQYPQYAITYSESGDFTFEGGYSVVDKYLKENPCDFDVIFSHNDDMALGAIKALEEHGIRPGTDVKIVSVDGTRAALDLMTEGKLNCDVECTPLFGPQLMKAIEDLVEGKELPLRIITDEKVFTEQNVKTELKDRKY